MSTKRSYILKQTCSWKLQVYLSLFVLLVDTIGTKGLTYFWLIFPFYTWFTAVFRDCKMGRLDGNELDLFKEDHHQFTVIFFEVFRIMYLLLKSGSHLPKKIFFVCFNDSPSKMMKNVFYFMLKALFVIKIF